MVKKNGGVFGRNPFSNLVSAITQATEEVGYDPDGMWYRACVKTGGFTRGTVDVRDDGTPIEKLSTVVG